MSENKGTIEERYEKVKETLVALWNHEDVTSEEANEAEKFVQDLMTEREKLKERIEPPEMDRIELAQHLRYLEEGLAPFSEYNWRVQRMREILEIPVED